MLIMIYMICEQAIHRQVRGAHTVLCKRDEKKNKGSDCSSNDFFVV